MVPLTGDLHDFLGGFVNERLVARVWQMAEKYRFFHWRLEFPEVFSQGGFDVLLCNPPWERIDLEEEGFLRTRDREIADVPNQAAWRRSIENLPRTNPAFWEEYREAKHLAEAQSKYFSRSGRYALTARGRINTYSVFAELFVGFFGSVARWIGIAYGYCHRYNSKTHFAHWVESGRLVSLCDFENREGVFPEYIGVTDSPSRTGPADGVCFTNGKEVWLPLYEAKMIWQFAHRLGTYTGVPENTSHTHLPTPGEDEDADPDYIVLPRYGIREEEAEARLEQRSRDGTKPVWKWARGWLLGFRDVTNATNERTAIFTVVPRVGVGNKIPLILLNDVGALRTVCFIGNSNSLVFDFVTRQKIGGTSLSYFIFKQLPVLPLDAIRVGSFCLSCPECWS